MFVELIFIVACFAILHLLVVVTGWPFFYLILLLPLALILPGLLAVIWAPFVPSSRSRVEEMVNFAGLQKGMKVFDLGAGDGRILKKAAQKGAIAIGYEYSFPLVLQFWLRNLVKKNGKMIWGSFWGRDYTDADVIFCYLFPGTMERFKRDIYPTLKPGTKIVSNSFHLAGLKPVKEKNNVFLYLR